MDKPFNPKQMNITENFICLDKKHTANKRLQH